MFDLSGRTALVTGASGGIGRGIAAALRERGAKVALSGTRKPALRELAEELGEGVEVLPCDLADKAAVDALPGRVEAAFGGLDILVNNAGITRDGLLLRMKDADWDEVLAVNLGAGMRLSRAALKGMMKRRYGRVIGIASVVGVTGNAGQANYAASKAGMIGFAKSLAREVATRGITANVVAPGLIETAMSGALDEQQREGLLSAVPQGRAGTVREVAGAVVYLASEEAGYVTGHTLHVNGGMAMV